MLANSTALLIDSNPERIELIKQLAGENDIRLLGVAEGFREALKIARANRPNIILIADQLLRNGDTSSEQIQRLGGGANILLGDAQIDPSIHRQIHFQITRPLDASSLRDTLELACNQIQTGNDLVRAEHRITALLRKISDGVLVISPEGYIIEANPQAHSLLGIASGDLVGKSITESMPLIRGEDLRPIDDLWSYLRFPENWNDNANPRVFLSRDGYVNRYLRLKTERWTDEEGDLKEIILVIEDATQQYSFEQECPKVADDDWAPRLIHGIAHDFNNLLGIMTSYADLIARTGANDSVKRYSDLIRKSAQKGVRMVRSINAISNKIYQVESSCFDISQTVIETANLLEKILGKNILLTTESLSPGPFRIVSDPVRVEQAIINLCINARDAIEDKGRISITLEQRELSDEEAKSVELQSGKYVILCIRDNGCGIAPENIEKIWQPYFTTKSAGKGTGLGLTNIRLLQRQCGGGISVSSEVGEGSIFTLFFPQYE